MLKQLQSQQGRYAYDNYTQALASIFKWTSPVSDNSYALEVDPWIYEKIRRDPVLAHVVDTAKRVTAGRKWGVEPASERPADMLRARVEEAALREIADFAGARFNLAEGLFRGSGHARIDGARRVLEVDGLPPMVWWVPTQLHDVDRRRFRLGRRDDGSVGWEFWSVQDYAWHALDDEQRSWFVSSRWRATEDTLGYGWGLYDALAEYAKAKTHLLAAGLSAANRFGQGLVTVALERHAGDPLAAAEAMRERAADARDAIQRSREDNVITYPKGDEVAFLEPGGQGFTMIRELIEYLDAQIRTLVLGGNLPSSATGGGSYALAVVQEHSSEAIGRHNREKLSEDLTRDLLGLFGRVNAVQLRRAGLGSARPGRFAILDDGTADDVGAFASALETLARVGVPVSRAEVYARTGLTPPKGDEPTTTLAAPVDPLPAAPPTSADPTPVGEGAGGVAEGA